MKTRLLKLIYLDDAGEQYHEAILSPQAARDTIVRQDIWAKLVIGGVECPFRALTWAEVSRASRAPVVTLSDGRKILIDVAS